MKTEIELLAQSLSAALAKYRPTKTESVKRTREAVLIRQRACNQRLRDARRANGLGANGKPLTDFGRKWGKLNVRAMFKRMAEEQCITESAARVRYYRRKNK